MTAVWSPETFAEMFKRVWKEDVKDTYNRGMLNSERALQACIVGALVDKAPDLVVLVEPTLYPEEKAGREMIPDLWIGERDSGRALAVIELKYVPFAYPEWKGDLEKLVTILREPYHAWTIDPATGKDDGVRIAVCDEIGHETLGVLAAVGKEDAEAVDTAVLSQALSDNKSLLPRFLHAWGRIPRNTGKWEFGVERLGVEPLATG
jgi:hypothetical protein